MPLAKKPNKKKLPKKSEVAGKKAKPALQILPMDPFSGVPVFPEWLVRDFPAYARDHTHDGPSRSVRVASHGGHAVKVTTTYEVEIDGRSVPLQMLVDAEGQLWTHLCPYFSFASAVDLVKHVIDNLPGAFELGPEPGGGGHDHGHHAPPAPEPQPHHH